MDKTSKVIFALIAAGLWFNAASNLPRRAYANSLATLVQGGANCTNQRLCQ